MNNGKNNKISSFLDFIRWVAALLVVLGHIRSMLFIEYAGVMNHNIFTRAFYYVSGLGHEAVICFFVLSGYLIGGNIIQKVETSTFDIKSYSVDRITRIYIVYIVALVVGYTFDYIGMNYFNLSGIYSHKYGSLINSLDYSVDSRMDVSTVVSNIFMLQTLYSETLGSNGSLWSLAYEAWYYIMFPCIYYSIFSNRDMKQKIIYILIAIGSLIIINKIMILYFIIWCAGAFSSRIHGKVIPSRLLAITIFVVTIVIGRFSVIQDRYMLDLLLCISLLLLVNSYHGAVIKPLFLRMINHKLSSFSYSLYLLHFPILLLMVAVYTQSIGPIIAKQPDYLQYMKACFAVLFAYIFSYLVSLISEKHTDKLRLYIKSLYAK